MPMAASPRAKTANRPSNESVSRDALVASLATLIDPSGSSSIQATAASLDNIADSADKTGDGVGFSSYTEQVGAYVITHFNVPVTAEGDAYAKGLAHILDNLHKKMCRPTEVGRHAFSKLR